MLKKYLLITDKTDRPYTDIRQPCKENLKVPLPLKFRYLFYCFIEINEIFVYEYFDV